MAMLSGCAGGVLDPQGPIGTGNRTILLNSLAVMLVIVIPTLVALLAFAWIFRASNRNARYDPEFTYSGRIELIVWSIPKTDAPCAKFSLAAMSWWASVISPFPFAGVAKMERSWFSL